MSTRACRGGGPHLCRARARAKATLYQSAVREEPDWNSRAVTGSERQGLESALAAFGAWPGTQQSLYTGLVPAAGVSGPAVWGVHTA